MTPSSSPDFVLSRAKVKKIPFPRRRVPAAAGRAKQILLTAPAIHRTAR
jgi:hypothetical protein